MKFQTDYSLKNKNTFGIESIAAEYINIEQTNELFNLGNVTEGKLLVLGGGSNIVLPERFEGKVIEVSITGVKIVDENDENTTVKAGAGEYWHNFIKTMIDTGIYGFENLALIPGKVGAAPIQNIGAYGIEQKKYFHKLEIFDLAKSELFEMSKNECEFGYRDSIFKNKMKSNFIITNVWYNFPKKWQPATTYKDINEVLQKNHNFIINPENIFNLVCEIRRSKLPEPEITGNAGSFFKNPVIDKNIYKKLILEHPDLNGYPENEGIKISSAKLIEKAGWKGKKLNENSRAGISEKHSLVIINLGAASFKDIYELSETIINDINQKFGILLEREVNMIK